MSGNGWHAFVLTLGLLTSGMAVEGDSFENTPYADEVSIKVENLEKEGSQYLKKVMKQLQEDRFTNEIEEVPDPNFLYTHRVQDDVYHGPFTGVTPVYNISAPTPIPEVEVALSSDAPPLSLSKEELVALYEAAVAKATQLHLKDGPKPEEESLAWDSNKVQVKPSHQGQMAGPLSGYYYYYFPIKSFITGQTDKAKMPASSTGKTPSMTKTTMKPTQQHLTATVTMIDAQTKAMEPLFMAISSFIGMALMFLFSVILVPRFQKMKSKNAHFDEAEQEMGSFYQIILEAMAGRDCTERLACEVTRIFRGIKSDNKTLRVLEIILPPNLSNQISHIRKAAGKNAKCGYILCKSRKILKPSSHAETSTIKTYVLRPWKEKKTPHELWMMHFEKNKGTKSKLTKKT